MFSRINGLAVVVFFLASSSISNAAIIATETWEGGDTAGWAGNTTSANVVHVADGGNPDGHIQSRRAGNFDIGALIDSDDSSDFTGDYAGVSGVRFDAALFAGEVSDLWLRFRRGPAEKRLAIPIRRNQPRGRTWGWNRLEQLRR